MRLDLALGQSVPDLSRKQIKKIIDSGGAYLNKRRINRAGAIVKSGDVLELYWQSGPKPSRFLRLTKDDVILMREGFLVINKPAGMPSQATLESADDTVVAALRRDLGIEEVFLVHRLDKETSGLMILARTAAARAVFDSYFKGQIVKKSYLALVCGSPADAKGSVSAAIAPDSLGKNRYRAIVENPRFKANRKVSGARSALTEYRVLETSMASGSAVSLVEFLPRTGRTHQIRVHSAQVLGCPLVGDKTYGSQVFGHAIHGQGPALRQMLHARSLRFPDPRTGEWLRVLAPLPSDFVDCLQASGLARSLEAPADDEPVSGPTED